MCGSYRRIWYAHKEGGSYARCRSCHTVYADPRPSDQLIVRRLDEFAPDLRDDTAASRSAAVAAEQWKLELVESLPLPGRRILDVGTGSGAFVAAAAEAGFDAEGHDLAPKVAVAAERRFGVTVHAGEVRDLEGTYDAVTMWDTLEHCVSPPAVVRDTARLLNPGGYLVILSPHSAGVSARLFRGGWWVYGPTDHIVMFSVRALGEALAEAGLRAVVLKTRQLAPPRPPEEADVPLPVAHLYERLKTSVRLQLGLSRFGLGDWIFAAAGRPSAR